MAKENRAKYPPGTRIMLLSMDDPHHPVPPGTRGTVEHVDDAGTIHMKWDNGRSLGICTEVDSIRTLTAAELAEEQAEKEEQQENPTEDKSAVCFRNTNTWTFSSAEMESLISSHPPQCFGLESKIGMITALSFLCCRMRELNT